MILAATSYWSTIRAGINVFKKSLD